MILRWYKRYPYTESPVLQYKHFEKWVNIPIVKETNYEWKQRNKN